MNLKLFIAGSCVAVSAMLFAQEQRLSEAAEYGNMPKDWELKKTCGRDFHSQFDFYLKQIQLSPPVYTGALLPDYLTPSASQPENIRKLAAMDCFRNVQYRFILREEEQADGSYTFPLEKLPLELKCTRGKPFTVELLSRPGLARIYYLAKFKHNKEAYRKWLAEHPEFRGFNTCEWGNDALLLHQKQRQKGILPGSSNFAITQADIDRLVTEKYPKPANRDEHVSGLLRTTFDRILEYGFDDSARLSIGEGHWCIGHLAAYWGAGGIGIETTRNYVFWQNQMMFCRGAARQFDIPWFWYVASYFEGFDSKGKRTSEGSLFSEDHPRLKWHGPDYGISLSSIKRAYYMVWLSGASVVEREAVENCFFLHLPPPEKQGLSEEGKMYVDFYRLTKNHPDRGIPYTPVALLAPANRGYCRFGGKAFTTYDYTQPDFMLDAVMSTILDYPNNRVLEKMRNGVECVMANQPYGDIFDAVTPDFEKQDSFRRALPNYKAAILIGDYGRNPGMAKILVDYVKNGGTLILNICQLNEDFPADFAGLRPTGKSVAKGCYTMDEVTLTGAKSIRTAPDGTILFAKNRYGKGSVIVGMQRWLTPWYGNDKEGQEAALRDTALGKPVRFPEIEWLMKELSRELLPVSVEGNIQYGLNRTKDGWLLYLINNSGVTKFADKPQRLDPKGQSVRIDVSRIASSDIFELLTEKKIEVRNGMIEVNVPSGDVRILKIR
ncbi:MAG: hypothetical protein BWY31_04087 [Lentisphaerae bacterium ADurb.Bin242]|nr:MAG: hypothetical protein BWY31_04087 [Lentisphaerae bacterium ADurb.Bin242]